MNEASSNGMIKLPAIKGLVMNNKKYTSVDEYIAYQAPEVQEKLQTMRQVIRKAVPLAEECISYCMPAYKQAGVLVYFAAQKKHIGFYPTPSGIQAFADALSDYTTSKGAIQFPLNKPIPKRLVAQITKYRLLENLSKPTKKK